MEKIYFDNAATTQMDPRVFEAMKPYFYVHYGNPGSMHSMGLEAKDALDTAREKVAGILGCDPMEVIFTGSGTESINMAVKGVAHALKDKGNHIITEKTEHHAVLETYEFLEKEGYEVTYLDVDQYGRIKVEDVKKAITDKTILVSIMYANNEIGTVQPVKEIAQICKDAGVYFHTDACQAAGYLDINVKSFPGLQLMSINGSKLYGPKGVGILYVKNGTKITPLIHGGGQENRLRSGTENIPYIIGIAKALEIAHEEKHEEVRRLKALQKKLTHGILDTIPKSFLNGHPIERLPNNVNISILDVEGEAVLLYLDQYGICASTGSACTSKTLDPSHVVLATGLPYEAAHGSIRFTLGRYTTEEGVDKLLKFLPGIIKTLRDLSPVNLNMKDIDLKGLQASPKMEAN
ncbi:MAG: cysteine desulfurase NifS [Candidatus Nanoarchaeia archaeon]